MKKSLQIAKYDFKRLMFNPITLVSLVVILAAVFIVGLVYKIPTTPAYTANLAGETTKEVYSSFIGSSTTYDTRSSCEQILSQAKNLLDIQADPDTDKEDLQQIAKDGFENVKNEVMKYNLTAPYTTSAVPDNIITQFQSFVTDLKTFATEYASKKEFESRLLLTKSQFNTIESIATSLYSVAYSGKSNRAIITDAYKYVSYFDKLQNVANTVNDLTLHGDIITSLQETYITKTLTKMTSIHADMLQLNNDAPTSYDTTDVKLMKSYATNYKKVAESAKQAVIDELYLYLYDMPKHNELYGYNMPDKQIIKSSLTEAKFYINNPKSNFVAYQTPLNFGQASYKVTAYDHSYMIISIIGFLNVLFGIFLAYKLFGRDRRNGKMDLLLSQKVSFAEVFAGKFMAILFCTMFVLTCFTILSFIWGAIFYKFLPNSIFAIFNLTTPYKIPAFVFLLLKMCGIELQVIFWSVITIFIMNISRKFDLTFAIALALFALATVGNIFLNGQIWYCLLPFIHADLTSYLGGATMSSGFLVTSLYSYGNFFISVIYYLVVIALLYNFTKNLFKKN